MKYGYARVSSAGQDLQVQEAALRDAGCDLIRTEKVSGTSINGRDELKILLEFLRSGDTLVITRIDRLARSVKDLETIVEQLDQKNVSLIATEQPIDTSTSVGKCFIQMLSVFAEFETNLRKERQMEGIKKAKANGMYKGRKKVIDEDKVRELRSKGLGATSIAREMKISRRSVYNVL
jgi:DNA invertase Pin-like site-specific DNA recombinase